MLIHPQDYDFKKLPVGASVKVAHRNCSGSQAMKITVKPEGVMFHCFKCNETRFVQQGFNFRDLKVRRAEQEAADQMKAAAGWDLPADFSHTISPVGLAWLGVGGWTSALTTKYNIGWSKKLARVIIPLQPEGWIARAVHKDQKPKYLSKAPSHAKWESSTIVDTVCLVEDVLSAGRVGQFLPTKACLGTEMDKWVPPEGVRLVVTWFDNDAAGRKALAAVTKKLQWFPHVKHINITTDEDPKLYSDAEIEEVLLSLKCIKPHSSC
jgi:hypothetical protein